jgi:tRNA(Ile)-lysidine synthase
MDKFLLNVLTEWRRLDLPFENAAVVAAVSGGADSVSLLLALDELKKRKKLNLRIIAAHFNHRLREGDSDSDEQFVKHLAGERGFELAVGSANISRDGNLEQNARNARYEFLHNTAASLGARTVLAAHTINDQAETFLLNLIRGSGPQGLGGMRSARPLAAGKGWENIGTSGTEGQTDTEEEKSVSPIMLVRPLLNWAKRRDTENFCRELGVVYRYDTMNENLAFTRVRIRKILLPLLEEFNPRIIETLANTSRLLRMQPQSDGAAAGGDEPLIGITDELSLSELRQLPAPELYRTLRGWLDHHRGGLRGLELKHIEAVERLIYSKKSGRNAELPNGGTVVKSGGKLSYRNLKVEK